MTKYGWLQGAIPKPKRTWTNPFKGWKVNDWPYKCRHIYLSWAKVSLDEHAPGHQFRCTCDRIFTVVTDRKNRRKLV